MPVVITIRVSEATAAAIDRARGGQNRPSWVRGLVEAELGLQAVTTGDGTVSAEKVGESCGHPRARVIKGFCYRCGKMVFDK